MQHLDILVRGGYGFSNFGDDLMMVILQDELHHLFPNKEIFFLCNKKPYLKHLLPFDHLIDYKDYSPDKFQIEHLIYGGGTQFYTFKTGRTLLFQKILNKLSNPQQLYKSIRHKLIRPNIFDNKFEIANSAKSISMLGIGAGPFENENQVKKKTQSLFQKADMVLVRDKKTKNLCREWQVSNYALMPDLFYAPYLRRLIESKIQPKTTYQKKIGIIVRDWEHTESGAAYYQQLISTTEQLRSNGYEIHYFIFNPLLDNYWMKKLKKRKERIHTWQPDQQSLTSYLKTLNDMDLIITARFHGGIIAHLLDKPYITIGVEQKLEMLATNYDSTNLCWRNPFDIAHLLNLVTFVNGNYEEIIQNSKFHKKEQQNNFQEIIKAYRKNLLT